MKKHNYLVFGLLILLAFLIVSCENEPQLQDVKDEASLRAAISKGTSQIILSDDIVVSSPIVVDGNK